MSISEQLKWTKQATQVKIKLNRAIGIPNKLKNITNRNTKWLIHSLFDSQLHHGAQLWGQTNTENKTNWNSSKQSNQKNNFQKTFWSNWFFNFNSVILRISKIAFLSAKVSIMKNLQKLSLPLSNVEIITARIIDQLLRNSWTYLNTEINTETYGT